MTIDFLSFNPDGKAYFWRISILNEDTRQVTAPFFLAIQFCCLIKKKSSIQVHKGRRESKDSFLLPTCRLPALLLPTLRRLLGLAASTVFSGNLSSFSWVVLLNHWKSIWPSPSQSPSTFWWLYLFSVSALPALLQTETKPVNSFLHPHLGWGWGYRWG